MYPTMIHDPADAWPQAAHFSDFSQCDRISMTLVLELLPSL